MSDSDSSRFTPSSTSIPTLRDGCDLLSAPEKQRFSGPEAALGVQSVPEL